MINTSKSLVNTLRKLKSYRKFSPDMLPEGIALNDLLSALEFLSPITVILHGSTISHKKFSNKRKGDLDIICVSIKASFWSIEELQTKAHESLNDSAVDVDLTIVSRNWFLSTLKGKSSISISLTHGFSILYPEEEK